MPARAKASAYFFKRESDEKEDTTPIQPPISVHENPPESTAFFKDYYSSANF
jgi:hypothetical protein